MGNLSFLGLSFSNLGASEIFGSDIWDLRSEISRQPLFIDTIALWDIILSFGERTRKNAVAKNQLQSRFLDVLSLEGYTDYI